MKIFVALYILSMVSRSLSKPASEESVVSVYTTEPNASRSYGTDIYRQIANNVVERISAPFHRLFYPDKNKTNTEVTTRNPFKFFGNLELLEDTKPTKSNADDNEIQFRDVEELSEEALNKKNDKKPEKISLLRYLPVNEHLVDNQINNTETNDLNETDDFDDIALDESTERQGPFIFILELIGSFIQLVYGAISALFKPSTTTTEEPN